MNESFNFPLYAQLIQSKSQASLSLISQLNDYLNLFEDLGVELTEEEIKSIEPLVFNALTLEDELSFVILTLNRSLSAIIQKRNPPTDKE